MNWKVFKYAWRWQLRSSLEELWPYVADTHRFNQATRLPEIEFTEIPLEIGGSRLMARTSKMGIVVEYEDHPFEWVTEQEFSNVRTFEQGPVARTYARLTLEPNQVGTLLGYYVEVIPANLLGLLGTPYQFGWEMRRNFERVFRQIDDYLQGRVEQPFSLESTLLRRSGWVRFSGLAEQLKAEGHQERWVQQLADLLIEAADLNLARIRPYALADTWGAPRHAILEMFLSAARLSILNMRWDVMCPLCRGAKATAPALDELRKGVHCPTCSIDYEANFTRNVELTFTPHPRIRAINAGTYCIGGPMITPHILIHQVVQPGETRTLHTRLEPGNYRVRTQRPGVEQWLEMRGEGEYEIGQLSIQASAGTIRTASQHDDGVGSEGLTLVMTNDAPYAQRIYVERSEWYTDAVTAAEVTALQHFRDLFSDEVLRPGEEIGIEGMTILFSDLVGSTAMYDRVGDAPSYALVRDQFAFLQRIVREYEGAIVKTIGDAIMAAFVDPANGVGAAFAIQQEIDRFNAEHPDLPLKIKLGMHHGPCIAVNLNGRLDYFGATVNLAARLEGQSKGGDVVVSERVRQDPAVAELLESMAVNLEGYETSIKGFDEHFVLYRLTLEGS
ncbi:MAG: adenylate/guanylate cyclase domain-containing protein [Anaerolineales bacterium]|nr:MAG: adenylate/guanylate cyclase domain-containing protein [Anaerolineales bacterium]